MPSICGITPRTEDDVQSTTTSGFDFLSAVRASGSTFTRSGRGKPGDLGHVATDFRGIDIDGADDAKPVPRGELSRHHDTDRTEAVDKDDGSCRIQQYTRMVGFCGDSARMSCDGRRSCTPAPLPPTHSRFRRATPTTRLTSRLDTRARTLTARETLVWTNITQRRDRRAAVPPLLQRVAERRLDVDARAHADIVVARSVARSGAEDSAAIDISSLKVTGGAVAPADLTGQMRFIAPDDGNQGRPHRHGGRAAVADRPGPDASRSTSSSRRRFRARSRAPA